MAATHSEDDLFVVMDPATATAQAGSTRMLTHVPGVWPSAHTRVLYPAASAREINCSFFVDRTYGYFAAYALNAWIHSGDGTLRGVAQRLFRTCTQGPIVTARSELLGTWPELVQYDLQGLVKFKRPGTDLEAEFRRRLSGINEARIRRGLNRLVKADQRILVDAIKSGRTGYWSNCWDCTGSVEEGFADRCDECGWLICLCGACRDQMHGGCTRASTSSLRS
jgi:hypothetical protein